MAFSSMRSPGRHLVVESSRWIFSLAWASKVEMMMDRNVCRKNFMDLASCVGEVDVLFGVEECGEGFYRVVADGVV